MIRNRAEAMSCGGCHQNSGDAEIAPNVIELGFFARLSGANKLST
jgi:hypothetical protein